MKKILTFLLLSVSCCLSVLGQVQEEQAYKILKERGEVCFSFQENNKEKLNALSKIISIDRKIGNEWMAYANETEFAEFLKKGYSYKLQKKAVDTKVGTIKMATTVTEMASWDRYPTYSVYQQMMQDFVFQYPDFCRIDTIGYSVENRLILVAEISASIRPNTPKPQFFYSATMHGDELTGCIFMLRLIDYLLSNYNKNTMVTTLLNEVQICINPLSNPDGTYYESNNNVAGATRYNAHNKDLNRNYPNPFSSNNNLTVEKENLAMISYMAKKQFTLSANLHGGAEVMNYPWDMYTSDVKTAADDSWWQLMAQNYVEACRVISPISFTDVDPKGITEGGDWYSINNGRQDYVNAYFKCREMTMEVSTKKTLDSDELNPYWDMQYKSLINYIDQVRYGLKGYVKDSATGNPIQAKITILNHDKDSSHVYSFLPFGNFYRLLKGGSYSVKISAPGYAPQILNNVAVTDFGITNLDTIKLSAGKDAGIADLEKIQRKYSLHYNNGMLSIESFEPVASIEVFDFKGSLLLSKQCENNLFFDVKLPQAAAGIYLLKISFQDKTFDFSKIGISKVE